MPLPSDEKLIALANDLLKEFDTIFGLHSGFRPAHAKGILLSGTFTPLPAAATLTRAIHFNRPSTRVWVRFSDATGLPMMPDNNPNSHPNGCAIRFYVSERQHTDIISHSTNAFPVHTGQEFLEFLRALAASDPANIKGSPLEAFLGSHPATLKFVQAPKPSPASFATEQYFGITAMRFTNQDGQSRYGRYRVVPDAGVAHLSDADASAKGENYLFEEIKGRISKGPVKLRVVAQLASDGDTVDDATAVWPEDRKLLDLGVVSLTSTVPNDADEQRWTIFDPIPRIDGIDPSDDPLLELRAALYLISGRRRRSATAAVSGGAAAVTPAGARAIHEP
jgi:catalase